MLGVNVYGSTVVVVAKIGLVKSAGPVADGGALTISSGSEGAVIKFTLPAAKVG